MGQSVCYTAYINLIYPVVRSSFGPWGSWLYPSFPMYFIKTMGGFYTLITNESIPHLSRSSACMPLSSTFQITWFKLFQKEGYTCLEPKNPSDVLLRVSEPSVWGQPARQVRVNIKSLWFGKLKEILFSVHLLAWTVASSVLEGSSAATPTPLEGRGLQREGRTTTIVPIGVLPCGGIDQLIWKLDTKKYLLTFNTGGSSGDTLDIWLPV